jgi:DNA segregation ATPase FtsK/SpoIIIE-like protein
MWLDLVDLPHLLVAGSTNSGKSVFLKSVVAALAAKQGSVTPEIAIIDPKAVDFAAFGGLPNLYGGSIVTEPAQAVELLQELVEVELGARTEELKEAACADVRELREVRGTAPPYRVVVIDEYADLRQALGPRERDGLEEAIARLAQRGRNVGLHVVIATQRPSVDVVTGRIKANIPCRISFKLPQLVDSRVVLDRAGGEHLLGKGDMLVLWNDILTRAQGYFASRVELDGWLSSRG